MKRVKYPLRFYLLFLPFRPLFGLLASPAFFCCVRGGQGRGGKSTHKLHILTHTYTHTHAFAYLHVQCMIVSSHSLSRACACACAALPAYPYYRPQSARRFHAASTLTTTADTATATAPSLPPLTSGQFRIILRSVPPSSITLRRPAPASLTHVLSMSQQLPKPSTIKSRDNKTEMIQSTHLPVDSVLTWISQQFGLDTMEQTQTIISSIQAQANRPEWIRSRRTTNKNVATATCGLSDSFTSNVQLQALHLWLIHVRLRSEDGDLSRRFTRVLFDLFWSTNRRLMLGNRSAGLPSHLPAGETIDGMMTQLTEVIYGLWVALDRGLIPVMEQRESVGEVAHANSSAAFGHLYFRIDAPDAEMLGALWRNTYLADTTLPPRHLPLLLSYLLQTIDHLYRIQTSDLLDGKFTWLDPPVLPWQPIPDVQRQRIEEYYQFLSTPTVQEDIDVERTSMKKDEWNVKRF